MCNISFILLFPVEKDSENKTLKVSHEQASLPSSISSAKKRLQFRGKTI